MSAELIIRKATVNGVQGRGLIVSGSSRTIIGPKFAINREQKYSSVLDGFIIGFDGSKSEVEGESMATIGLAGKLSSVRVVHSKSMLPGIDLIIGLDVLRQYKVILDHGSVTVSAATAGRMMRPGSDGLRVEGPNFEARFADGYWTAHWDWSKEPDLKQKVGQYAVSPQLSEEFKKGVQKWINHGWLKERKEPTARPPVPLMAVFQETKGKVRPVLDYREVNDSVHASGAEADVSAEKMREWRTFPENSATVDIKDAYMQIRVTPECSRCQTVRYEGREYELGRMGFGLNCAPQILKAVVNRVLSIDPAVRAATSAYFGRHHRG